MLARNAPKDSHSQGRVFDARRLLESILRQLRDQQVRFAPREKKLEQVDRAERLIPELDLSRTYTYEYLCYRITDFRPDSFPNFKLSGEEAATIYACSSRTCRSRPTCRPRRPASRC